MPKPVLVLLLSVPVVVAQPAPGRSCPTACGIPGCCSPTFNRTAAGRKEACATWSPEPLRALSGPKG